MFIHIVVLFTTTWLLLDFVILISLNAYDHFSVYSSYINMKELFCIFCPQIQYQWIIKWTILTELKDKSLNEIAI